MAKKINADRIQLAEFVRQIHRISVPVEHNYEDLLDPAYWVNVAPRLTSGDRIEARAEDGSWFAEFYVRSTTKISATVHPLLHTDFKPKNESHASESHGVHGGEGSTLPAAPATAAAEFHAEWKGPNNKWSVIRKGDKEYASKGHATREEAEAWIVANAADAALA
jgi:hypothetical protein